MAQHRVPSGVDPIDFLLRENANLANRVQALEGRRLSTWDRYYHDEVAAPVEGQHVVEPTTEGVWYYSDGVWRQLGGVSMPGFHAWKNSTLTCTSGTNAQLNWDSWTIDDDSIFGEGALSGADLTEVEILTQGWYAIHCWATWTTQPASGFGGIAMVHDDVDIAEPRAAMGVTYPMNWSSQGSMTFQAVRYFVPVYTGSGTGILDKLEFWVIQNSGVNRDINEAYCNIAYLGDRP